MAKAVLSRFQPVVQRHPLIKNKALPLPAALGFRHLLEVLEDAAAQVVHLPETLLLQVAAGFFAADPAGAEHGDALAALLFDQGPQRGLCPLREVAEALGAGVDGPLEAADRRFVAVAGVDHQGVGIIHQGIPVFGFHIGAHAGAGIHAGHADGHDLLFAAGLETAEHRLFGPAALHLEPCVVVVAQIQRGTQVIQHRINAVLWSADRAIHPFMGHQHRSEHAAFASQARQAGQQCLPTLVIQGREGIERCHQESAVLGQHRLQVAWIHALTGSTVLQPASGRGVPPRCCSSGFPADPHRSRLQGTGQGMEGLVPSFKDQASHRLSVGAVDLHG